MGYDDFIATLSPKIAKAVRTALETKIEKLELASYGLTKALNGGIARGRITLFYGNTSCGKSLLLMQSIGLWQKQGLVCAYVDVEGTYDKEFGARLGVNNAELILIQTKTSGRVESEIAPLLQADIDVLVIDSISDIMPEVFVGKDGEMNDQGDRKQLGAHAKAITALVHGIHYLNRTTAVALISQTTTFIGQSYVEQVPHGGQKTQFASSQIVKLTSSATEASQIKGEIYVGDIIIESPIGRGVDFLVKKNKLGPAFGKGTYNMYYAGKAIGIDRVDEIISRAVVCQVVRKSGAWYFHDEDKYQGKSSLVNDLKKNPDKLVTIQKSIHTVETGEA